MGAGRLRWAARVTAVVGAWAFLGGAPGVAQADTRYDGEATALRIEGLQLQLLPGGSEHLPPELRAAVEELQAQAPEQMQRDSLTLAMPDQVIGHAEYEGTDTQGAIPPNPLLTADVLEARSVPTGRGMLSEASVAGLEIGGGVLTADVIRTRCLGDGEGITLDVSQLELGSSEEIVDGRVSLRSGTAVPITGLGSITFNQRDTDGSTYGEATNVVIDLDSSLSLEMLARLFDDVADLRAALDQVLADLGRTKLGPEAPFGQLTDGVRQALAEAGPQVEDGGDQGAEGVVDTMPQQMKDAVNQVLAGAAHLQGTVTISNAACAQQTLTGQAGAPSQPQQAAPVQPAAQNQPPLADTGAPAGVLALGLAGLAALAGGGLVLLRLRHGGA